MMLATDLAVLRPQRRLPAARRQRRQLRRHRRARRGRLGRRRRAPRPDDRRAGRSRPRAPSRRSSRSPASRRSSRHPGAVRGAWSSEAKEAIRAGEAFQIVVSQRFTVPCRGRRARRLPRAAGQQPEPLHVPPAAAAPRRLAYDVVGSSPEALVKVTGRRRSPTRSPGRGRAARRPEHDAHLAEELLGDAKERAEHLMLVDLARNDLQRICRAGTVDTVDFMSVRALQPHHAHRVDRRRRPARRTAPPTTRSSRPSRRAR